MTMAINPLRGEAALVTSEGEFKLVFDVNAFCLAEMVLSQTTDEIVAAFEKQPGSLTLQRALIWAAIQGVHDCDLEEAGRIAANAGVNARDAVMAGLRAAFGVEDGDKPRPPKKRAAAATG